MMMFSGIAVAVALIALAGGVGLLIWSLRNEGHGVTLAKIFGYIISILSVLTILITIFSSAMMSWEMKDMMKSGCSMSKMM